MNPGPGRNNVCVGEQAGQRSDSTDRRNVDFANVTSVLLAERTTSKPATGEAGGAAGRCAKGERNGR